MCCLMDALRRCGCSIHKVPENRWKGALLFWSENGFEKLLQVWFQSDDFKIDSKVDLKASQINQFHDQRLGCEELALNIQNRLESKFLDSDFLAVSCGQICLESKLRLNCCLALRSFRKFSERHLGSSVLHLATTRNQLWTSLLNSSFEVQDPEHQLWTSFLTTIPELHY